MERGRERGREGGREIFLKPIHSLGPYWEERIFHNKQRQVMWVWAKERGCTILCKLRTFPKGTDTSVVPNIEFLQK